MQLRERIEGKIGAKWMRKVFRYKGEEAGASDEVLNELLGHAAAQQRARDDAFGHSAASVKCIEHMLKDMSEQFVASMNTFGSKQLDGMSLQHLIGPFAKDLEAIEQQIGLADEEQDRMTGEALALDEMFAVAEQKAKNRREREKTGLEEEKAQALTLEREKKAKLAMRKKMMMRGFKAKVAISMATHEVACAVISDNKK